MSFGALFNESTTVQFPVDDAKIVAPFWDEYQDRINTSRQIKYFVNNVSDSMFLMEINGFLKDFQYTEYTAQWAFIVQWIDVCIEMDNCNELEVCGNNNYIEICLSITISGKCVSASIDYRRHHISSNIHLSV